MSKDGPSAAAGILTSMLSRVLETAPLNSQFLLIRDRNFMHRNMQNMPYKCMEKYINMHEIMREEYNLCAEF